MTSWWFQPLWKICSSNWIIFLNFPGKNKKCLSCRHRSMSDVAVMSFYGFLLQDLPWLGPAPMSLKRVSKRCICRTCDDLTWLKESMGDSWISLFHGWKCVVRNMYIYIYRIYESIWPHDWKVWCSTTSHLETYINNTLFIYVRLKRRLSWYEG